MTTPALSRLSSACFLALASLTLAQPARAAETTSATDAPPAQPVATAREGIDANLDAPETPIVVPSPVPTGILIAWKPTLLSVRIDTGAGGDKFGSDKLQALRGLARYTFLFDPDIPFVGRVELEGGQFKSDSQYAFAGSTGTDFTLRAMVGAATRITSRFTVFASVGAITRYQYGRASGGAPTIGVLGVLSNMELEFRLLPQLTLSLFAEAALAPIPYAAERDLGILSDASELRARLQFSLDLTRDVALDVGYDFTRWHTSLSGSTILGNSLPNQALLIEDRENALTLGVRWKL